MNNNSEIILYRAQDGQTKIEVTLQGETVWLSQAQMAELFQRDTSVISRHIKNIYSEGELDEKSTLHFMQIANSDRPVAFYNLDVIISVGYRVKSLRGTQFRIWATKTLKEYLIKGFALNDDLLKEAGGGQYWQELLSRIRDIRSSEKIFYSQILDIYTTSIDYDKDAEISKEFFKVVQNKMHYAAHKHTAAEILYERADSNEPFMGLTAFKGLKPTKAEALIAKNYLTADELNILNRITTAYLEFAELQALRRQPMYMKDWIARLDDFIRMTGRDLLENQGIISRLQAENRALEEYGKYKVKSKEEISQAERDFLESIGEIKKIHKQIENKNKK